MSFILDALRKSDKKRPVGSVPDLQTDHLGPPPKPRRSLTPVLMVLAVALLVNAGLLLWWWQPWRAADEPVLAAEMQDSEAGGAEVAQIVAPVPAPVPGEPAAVTAPAASVPAPPGAPPLFAPPPQAAEPVQHTVIFVDEPAEARAAAPLRQIQQPPVASPEQELELFMADIPLLEDLPAALRAGLPEMSFSLHYYTVNPSERLVRINGRLLREGQMLGEGLILEEITPGGAVFEHRGLLFEVLRY